MEKLLYTLEEARKMLGVSTYVLQQMVKLGQVKKVRVGNASDDQRSGRHFITGKSIEELIDK